MASCPVFFTFMYDGTNRLVRWDVERGKSTTREEFLQRIFDIFELDVNEVGLARIGFVVSKRYIGLDTDEDVSLMFEWAVTKNVDMVFVRLDSRGWSDDSPVSAQQKTSQQKIAR